MRTLLDTARTWERTAASLRRRVELGAASGCETELAQALYSCAADLRVIVGLPRSSDPFANLPGPVGVPHA